MRLEGVIHCDGPDCDHHAHVSADGARRAVFDERGGRMNDNLHTLTADDCTGYVDDEGYIIHEGDECPIHEGPGCPRCANASIADITGVFVCRNSACADFRKVVA